MERKTLGEWCHRAAKDGGNEWRRVRKEMGCDEREGKRDAMGGGLVEREKTRERESDINEKLEI